MFIFEFTDKEIIIYNKKKKSLIKELIPENIIVNNRVYDYLKLVNIINKIVNKYKVNNTLFRVNINILVFERLSPSNIYLLKNAFKSISNFKVEIINVSRYFDNNYIFISGDIIYYDNKVLKNIKNGSYILIGNSDHFQEYKKSLEKRYKIDILEYENSNTIIYEKI